MTPKIYKYVCIRVKKTKPRVPLEEFIVYKRLHGDVTFLLRKRFYLKDDEEWIITKYDTKAT